MADEWGTVRFGDVAASISETHPRTASQLVFLNTSDVLNGKLLHTEYSSVASWPGQAKKSIKQDDILFSEIRPANRRYAYVDRPVDDFVVSTKLMVIRADSPKVLPRFLYFFLTQTNVTSWLQHLAESRSGTFPQITFDQIAELDLPLPPLTIQATISAFADTLQRNIDLTRERNSTLEAIARALFRSWFVDFDPVRAKTEGRATGLPAHITALFPDSFEDSELGEIPAGWRATTLGAEAKQHGGKIQTGPFGSQLHASDYSKRGVPVVMPQDIANRCVSTSRVARVQEVIAERLSRHRLQPGDIIYSRRGDVERHAQIGPAEAGWLCGTGCLMVRMGPEWPSPVYISLALDRPEARGWISQHAIGATMPNLNTGILSAVPLVVPPAAVLKEFSRLVAPVDRLISEKNAESQTLESMRDALLPKLISGEIRLGSRRSSVGLPEGVSSDLCAKP